MADPVKATQTVIKKYANRRLYHTGTSTYVTLEDLATMVQGGEDFVVYDARSGDDITRSSVPQRARAGLGRTFQTSSLFPRLSVLENVRLAAQARLGGNYSLLRFPRRSDPATELVETRAKLQAVLGVLVRP